MTAQMATRLSLGSLKHKTAKSLMFLVPPESVTMLDLNTPGGYNPGAVVRVTQDAVHSMQCVIRATIPDCNVIWTLDGTDLQSTANVGTPNRADQRFFDTTSTIEFVPQRSHHRKTLICSAVINVLGRDIPSPPVSKQVQLQVYGKLVSTL